MGTAALINIKRRLKSIESTRKITKAMGLVATSKLRKVKKQLKENEELYKEISNIANILINNVSNKEEKKIFTPSNSNAAKVYIVITSDTGLCGGFNSNVINCLKTLVEDKNKTKIILVGSKGLSYLKKTGIEMISNFVDIPEAPTVKEVKVIYDSALTLYSNGEVSEVNLLYTNFGNHNKQEVVVEKLLPITDYEVVDEDIKIEPDIDEAVNIGVNMYLMTKIKRGLLHSKASENSNRITSMDGATKNANDIIKSLNIQYNRARQAMITAEISEIIGGAEAQK